MSTEPVVFETAAERILAEKAQGYKFAPGITLYAPSKAQAEKMAEMMQDIDVENNPSQEDVLAVLAVLLGEKFHAVMDYLDGFPSDAYIDLFADLFTNLMRLVPKEADLNEKVEVAQSVWREEHPDLYPEDK